MDFIFISKTPSSFTLVVLGVVLINRGTGHDDDIAAAQWLILSPGSINIRTRKRTFFVRYKDVICGEPATTDIPIGPKEELTTSDGRFVVQPAERRTTYPRFAKPVIDPRSFYFIHEHPFKSNAELILSRNVEGVVGDSPIDAVGTFCDLIELTQDMAAEFKSLSVNQPE